MLSHEGKDIGHSWWEKGTRSCRPAWPGHGDTGYRRHRRPGIPDGVLIVCMNNGVEAPDRNKEDPVNNSV